jgi:hypothetical protein
MDTANSGSNRPEKLKWHPAFLQALQLELIEYKNSLQFKYEYQLTAEPLRVDLLIIKKPRDLAIEKNIARIFKSDNIIEFKSPEDYLPIQIIETKRLSAEENLWLKSLTNDRDPVRQAVY